MTVLVALSMKYNRLSDREPFELRIEGAAMGSLVSAVTANLHIKSHRSNR